MSPEELIENMSLVQGLVKIRIMAMAKGMKRMRLRIKTLLATISRIESKKRQIVYEQRHITM